MMELKGKKINFLGDSITQGVGVTSQDKIYLNLIKQKENLAEARNYGISGTRIARKSEPDEWGPAFCDRYLGMDDDADIIVVFGGTNDFGHGDVVLGEFSDREGNTFYGACHELMSGLLAKYPTALIVFLTPLHRIGDLFGGRFCDIALESYVKIIKVVAGYYALPVLDLFTMSGIQPEVPPIREKYCPDGLHPNDAGHELIASRLTGFLKSL